MAEGWVVTAGVWGLPLGQAWRLLGCLSGTTKLCCDDSHLFTCFDFSESLSYPVKSGVQALGVAVRMPKSPGSIPSSGFLLLHTLGGSSVGSSDWLPATHAGKTRMEFLTARLGPLWASGGAHGWVAALLCVCCLS